MDSIAGATGARFSLLPPENATGNFVKVVQRIPVKIVLRPAAPKAYVLRPGMNVDATIFTEMNAHEPQPWPPRTGPINPG